MKATIFFHDVPTQGENLVEIEFTAEPVWAAAAPTQPAGELRDLLKEYLVGGHSPEGRGMWSCGCDLCERTRAALQRERK